MAGPTEPSAHDDMDRVFELEWRRSRLKAALDIVARETDPQVFQAFEAYAVHDTPPRKVARMLGMSTNAVYISKTRVLKRLRSVIEQLEAEEA